MPLFAFDPYVRLDLAKNRQSHVPDRLVATGVLTRPDASAAASAPLHLRGLPGPDGRTARGQG